MDLSIIIPSRGSPLGSWATVHSCYEDLIGHKYSYEFIVVSNGDKTEPNEISALKYQLEHNGLGKVVHVPTVLTPSAARRVGVEESSGRICFFFDNHCLVSKDYFRLAMAMLDREDVDLLHSSTQFYAGDVVHYQYRLKLAYNFWGVSETVPDNAWLPYQIAAAGHGGFAVSRAVWDAVGGYGPDDLLSGYGGEELLFDLKAWRYGFKNWIHPKLIHYHFAGVRGYARHYSDEYYTNMMVSAYVIGGREWLHKVYDSFETNGHVRINAVLPMYDLLQLAERRGREYSAEVERNSKYSLNALLSMFKHTLVAL
jgi:glycosyltransferase involved in cell wall biosynthesis